jgi:hypothetical protein
MTIEWDLRSGQMSIKEGPANLPGLLAALRDLA